MISQSIHARVVSTLAALLVAAPAAAAPLAQDDGPVPTANPLLFVTQVPLPYDYLKVASTFGNHRGTPSSAPRGGDLWIRYEDGTLRNLTEEAGFGSSGPFQGARSIAVREPCVHWSGNRALFSMVVGAPSGPYEAEYYWQIYEVRGLARGRPARIERVPFQAPNRNNVSPVYASDGRILFTSDRMREYAPHMYPQLDEYEEAATTTGIWSLDPETGRQFLLNHAPSGAFKPTVDSFGRVVFTRWDHLERDQQADLERMGLGNYGVYNWSGEEPDSVPTTATWEFFPEARPQWMYFYENSGTWSGPRFGWRPDLTGNSFNFFLPWTLNQDGSGEETLNHVGRHELFASVPAARDDDFNVRPQHAFPAWVANRSPITSLHQLREDPRRPGSFVGIDCREFDTHACGQIVRLSGAPDMNANEMEVTYLTHRDTQAPTQTPGPNHSGLYRNPLPMAGGRMIASHTPNTLKDANIGTVDEPRSRYDLRLKSIVPDANGYLVAGRPLTNGIRKRVHWFDPFKLQTYDGDLWELDPVEVVARPVPPDTSEPELALPERRMLALEGVDESALRAYLLDHDLALIVGRNVTSRDKSDSQQPWSLFVPGGTASLAPGGGTAYQAAFLRIFQGDLIRGIRNGAYGTAGGRRVLAQPLHEPAAVNPPAVGGPSGSVAIEPDGSFAALVPARRAVTWQLTDSSGEGVVNERYWVSFQPGEIRTCTGCHGSNETDQLDRQPPTNAPQALRKLLEHLRANGSL